MLLHTSYLCPLKTTLHKGAHLNTLFFYTADFHTQVCFIALRVKRRKEKKGSNICFGGPKRQLLEVRSWKRRSKSSKTKVWLVRADWLIRRHNLRQTSGTLNLWSQPTTNEPSAACIFTCKHRSVFRFCYICMEYIIYDVLLFLFFDFCWKISGRIPSKTKIVILKPIRSDVYSGMHWFLKAGGANWNTYWIKVGPCATWN